MSKRGNGADAPEDTQTHQEPEESPPAQEAQPAEDPPVPANSVTELVNTAGGCWKVLADGQRVELSDKDWRKELARLLAPGTPGA